MSSTEFSKELNQLNTKLFELFRRLGDAPLEGVIGTEKRILSWALKKSSDNSEDFFVQEVVRLKMFNRLIECIEEEFLSN
jgi:hypothetical protein